MADHQNDNTDKGEGQMGLFGGPGPVLGGTAGGKDYSLNSMLERANAKKTGDSSDAKNKKDIEGPILSTGTKDLLEGSGLLPGAKRGWEPNTPPPKASAPAAGSKEGDFGARPDMKDLQPAMSEGARDLLQGSGLLREQKSD